MAEYIVNINEEEVGEFDFIAITTLKEIGIPVIRCRDCIHRDPEDKKCDSGHFIQWQLPREDDWYCADSERREEE